MPLGSLETAWGELENARVALFGGLPRIQGPRRAMEGLLAFAKAHEMDWAWGLDTYVRWAKRDAKYAKSLDPEGAPEVFLSDSQWPRFQKERPPPAAPPCAAPGCQFESTREVEGIPVCGSHFYEVYTDDTQSAAEVRSLLGIAVERVEISA
jgi:hypothetical protein